MRIIHNNNNIVNSITDRNSLYRNDYIIIVRVGVQMGNENTFVCVMMRNKQQ